MTLRSWALLSAAFCTLMPAGYADATGWYMGLGTGLSIPSDIGMPNNSTLTFGSSTFHFTAVERESTGQGLGTFGYSWDNHLRLEGEIGYRDPGIRGVVVSGQTAPIDNADLSEFTLFGNVLYDLPLTEKVSMTLGGGLGASFTELQVGSAKQDSNGFAFQAIAGLSYHWSDQADFAFDYRYVRTTGLDYFGGNSDAGTHNLMLSLRWFFDRRASAPAIKAAAILPPPPPPPPEAASPAAVKTYIVFFDSNKSYLTDAAEAVVAEAVKVAATKGIVKVQIAGHISTIGEANYTKSLTLARASTVKEAMIRFGLDGSTIAIEGHGANEPQISLGVGTHLSQSRHAVIDLGV